MEFIHFLYLYFGLTALLIFILLFGESPWAAGTPLPHLRWLVTSAWLEGLEWAVKRAFGMRGLTALDRATECCCERSNPTLQIAYLLIWLVGYGLYWQHIFKLLPNRFAAEYHLFTGTAAVCLTLTTFLAASLSEPGAITPANAAAHHAAYPCDGQLFPAKACSSCNLLRPGRSKHCSACGSCIARFDHHCAWINNCVGLGNTRLFLAFLAANAATCAYALALAAAALAGDLARRGAFDVFVYDPVLRTRVPLHTRPARLLEAVLVWYPVPVAVAAFLGVSGMMLAGLLAHQAFLISTGRTTYETFKRDALHKQLREQARAARQQQQQQQQGETVASGGGMWGWWQRLQQRWRRGRLPAVALPPNYYDRGFWGNWAEVLLPQRFLQQQQQQQSRHGSSVDGKVGDPPAGGGGSSSHHEADLNTVAAAAAAKKAT